MSRALTFHREETYEEVLTVEAVCAVAGEGEREVRREDKFF